MPVFDQVAQLIGSYVPNLLGALLILIVGWLVALVLSRLLGKAADRTGLSRKLHTWTTGESAGEEVRPGRWLSRASFWILMVFVLVAFFQALGLTLLTEPLNRMLGRISEYLPAVAGALLLLLLAWILASVIRFFVRRALEFARLDARLGGQIGLEEAPSASKSIAEAVYWLVFLLFLPAIIGALGLHGLLEPVQGLLDKVLGILPDITAAFLILLVGWFVARVVQRIVTSLLVAIGTDRLGDRMGLRTAAASQGLSRTIGLVLYVLILIPVLIAALDALGIDAVTAPASGMLAVILGAIPAIFTALLVLAVAFFLGRLVADLLAAMLAGIGFDTILTRLGLHGSMSEGSRKPSRIAGSLILIAVMLFASIEAARLLGFVVLADLVAQFVRFGGHIILGLVIFGLGLYVANLVSGAISSSNTRHTRLLVMASRISILVLAAAMALRQMGLANEIINLAFGLLLGAVAVAFALAFGIGGRDVASRYLERWTKSGG